MLMGYYTKFWMTFTRGGERIGSTIIATILNKYDLERFSNERGRNLIG